MTDCPRCGYHDPFMRSWFDSEKDTSEFLYFKEWDIELWHYLQIYPYIEYDGYIYHKTASSVYRTKIEVLSARKGGRIIFDKGMRVNRHLDNKI